jgi:UDP-N-acetylmuramate--alanine ligase
MNAAAAARAATATKLPTQLGPIHFTGIGGIGMSGIAEVLITLGYTVQGSDLKGSKITERLESLGARVFIGQAAENLAEAEVVVISSAIKPGNPELEEARRRGLPVVRRAEMLAELMRLKSNVAIAGTHGKTTTTTLVATLLDAGGIDPTVINGGIIHAYGSNARAGAGEWMVVEADESDGTFNRLPATIAIVTNIDPEHMEHWGTEDALLQGFADFANKVPFFGFATLCLDNPNVQRLLPMLNRQVVTYGFSAQAEVRGEDVVTEGLNTRFTVLHKGARLGEVTLHMPGRHNVLNALAAIAVGLELGVDFAHLARGLDGFTGVDRRFSIRHEVVLDEDEPPVTIIDDYGHHPTEIQATLQGATDAFPHRRLVAVFQPHRYTRVRDHFDDFARSFHGAGHVVVCPVYRAGEAPIDGIDEANMGVRIAQFGHRSVRVVGDLDAATAHLADHVKAGDVVITLGAGNVNSVCGALAAKLRARA